MPGFLRQVAAERLGGALWAVALARRVLHQTRDRLQPGPLWSNESVRQRFGRCLLEYRKLVALCRRVDGLTTLDGLLLKAAATQTLELVLAECAQLHGADGFADGGIQHLRAEAAMFGIAGGVTELMLAGIADHADTLLTEAAA
jgi:alkylation response protein AidB-like acyl-CoA dehydrogenase